MRKIALFYSLAVSSPSNASYIKALASFQNNCVRRSRKGGTGRRVGSSLEADCGKPRPGTVTSRDPYHQDKVKFLSVYFPIILL